MAFALGELLGTDGEGDGQDSGHDNGDTTGEEDEDAVKTVAVLEAEAGVQAEDVGNDDARWTCQPCILRTLSNRDRGERE